MSRFRGEVNHNRLIASRGDVTKGNLLLIPTDARRGGGFARGGACGIHSARGAGVVSIRRSRCTCRGARRSRGARAGGACGCACNGQISGQSCQVLSWERSNYFIEPLSSEQR